jgi:hypothetical protein
MILSVPEGHDKPYKYPNIFQISEAVILNKVDTMPVFDFDEEEFRSVVNSLNPKAPIFRIAATKGEGVDAWAEWLAERIEQVRHGCRQGADDDHARRGHELVIRADPPSAISSRTAWRPRSSCARSPSISARAPKMSSAGGSRGCCTTWTTPRPPRTSSGTGT